MYYQLKVKLKKKWMEVSRDSTSVKMLVTVPKELVWNGL